MLIEIQSLHLTEPLDESGGCLVLVELILPRNAIRSRSALREVALKRGKRSLARAPFYEKALLKEKVDGRFGLKVGVTRPMPASAMSRLLRSFLATAVETAPDFVAAFSDLAFPLSRLADGLVDEAADQFADHILDDGPVFVAVGGLDLDSERLGTGTRSIPLKLSQTLRLQPALKLSEKREKRRRATESFRKGMKVGEIRLAFETEDS